MNKYIDIHSHIIPKVDDGAHSIQQAMRIVKIAYENDIRAIIGTPHYEVGKYDDNQEDIIKSYQKLKQSIEKEYPDFKLYLGREIFFSDSVPEKLMNGEIDSLNDSKYALIEFSPDDTAKYIQESLYRVTMAGFKPILAHAERYEELMKDTDYFDEIIEAGTLVQVNSATLAGRYGRKLRKQALNLIRNDYVHFIATDSHSDGHRAPILDKCVKYLSRKVGEDVVRKLLKINPQKVINNEEI